MKTLLKRSAQLSLASVLALKAGDAWQRPLFPQRAQAEEDEVMKLVEQNDLLGSMLKHEFAGGDLAKSPKS